MSANGITDAQLLALGRFTWAAMKLEAWVDRVCETLVPQSSTKGLIGNHRNAVKRAIPNPNAVQANAIAWLDEAVEALDQRNRVLHSQLQAFWIGDTPEPPPIQDWEMRLVNHRRGSSVKFTTDGLEQLQSRIEDVQASGYTIDVALALSER